jgi:hypothetical protein
MEEGLHIPVIALDDLVDMKRVDGNECADDTAAASQLARCGTGVCADDREGALRSILSITREGGVS